MNTQDAMQFESLPFDPSPRRRARSAARRAGGGQGGGSSGCGCGQDSGAAAEFDGEWGHGSGESEDETDAEFDGEQDSEFDAELDGEMPDQEETDDEVDSERGRMARGGPRGASRAGRAGLRPPQRFRPPPAGRPRSRPRGPGAAFGWNPVASPAEPAAPCVCPSHGSEFARWVQSTLNRLTGAGLPVNGAMNAATRRAVRAFQARRGLPVDGIVGPETEQALRAARLEGSSTVAGDEDEPQSEFDTDFELDEMNDGEAEAFESPAPRRVLRSGSRGTDVSDLQRRLNAAGFDSGAVDGVFGTRTDRAVRAFQAARRLSVDGIVGSQTWAALLGGSSVPVPVVTADRWAIPASVREAAQAQYVRYDSPPAWAGNPGNCTGTFTDGARTLKEYIEQNFPGVTSIGGYSCRANTANTAETSVHGVGRALDIMITPVGGRANAAVGDRIANWLLQNAAAIGVQYVIWNRVRWNGSVRSGSKDAPYTGPNPHIDHVHAEINLDAATRRTPWFRGR